MMTGQPIIILKEGTEREKGKGAVSNNIAAARAVADAVKSTLGPKGMDKMLVDSLGDVTILKEIEIEHPTAKMLVEVAKTQDDEVGDGTTSAVILAGELLKAAESLIESQVHPTIIVNGYRMAAAEAVRRLNQLAFPVKRDDKTALRSIARTAMSGRSVGANADFLAGIAVDAVQSIVEEIAGEVRADVDNILVQKKHGGNLTDTALINRALEVKKTEVNEEIRIRDPGKLQLFLNEEEKSLKTMVDKIKASGANVVLCQKGIDDVAQHYLAKEGIYAVRRVKESDMKKLAKATGARSVTNLDDLTPKELGNADLVEERKIGTDDMTFVTGNKKARAVSILVRGGTEHVVDEVERILHDALRVVSAAIEDGKAIAGGGAAEVELSLGLKDYAATIGGREQLAIEAFAHALDVIPRTLGENAGLDPIDVLIKLRAEHGKKGGKSMGVNVMTGEPLDMLKANVVEPLRVKTQEIESASEVAGMILRIDDIIASKKSPPPPPGGGEHGHGGGMGGMGGMPGMGM